MAIGLRVLQAAKRYGLVRFLVPVLLLGGLAAAFVGPYGQAADKDRKLPATGDKAAAVVVVDVARAVDSHKRLQVRKRELEVDLRAADSEVAEERRVVQELKDQRDAHAKESAEYAKLDALLTRKQT